MSWSSLTPVPALAPQTISFSVHKSISTARCVKISTAFRSSYRSGLSARRSPKSKSCTRWKSANTRLKRDPSRARLLLRKSIVNSAFWSVSQSRATRQAWVRWRSVAPRKSRKINCVPAMARKKFCSVKRRSKSATIVKKRMLTSLLFTHSTPWKSS